MNCCANCFHEQHEHLAHVIAERGTLGDCGYCGSKGVTCVAAEALRPEFEPVVSRFERWDPAKHVPRPGWSDTRNPLLEFMKVFGVWNACLSEGQRQALFADIVGAETADRTTLWVSRYQDSEDDPWQAFCSHIKQARRFIPDEQEQSVTTFLQVLPRALDEAAADVAEGAVYHRARIGGTALDYIPEPFTAENMGAPPPQLTRAGRANSSGIPVLYAATDEPTAIAEVRPWKHAYVTVAELRLVRSVRLAEMNLRLDSPKCSPFGRQDLDSHYARVSLLWKISSSLAEPVSPQTCDVDYLPTQYVAEAVRHLGYGGMLYTSAMGPGTNVLFFDPAVAQVTGTKLVWVYGIDYRCEDAV